MDSIEVCATKLERKATAMRAIASAIKDLAPDEQRDVLDEVIDQLAENVPTIAVVPAPARQIRAPKNAGPVRSPGPRADQAASIVEKHGTATLEVVAKEMGASKSAACHALRGAVASGRIEKDPQAAGVYRSKAA
jgi:hypothetical protein